jgi:hypothetical protein
MNIIDLQERLKDLPETALMQEMQMPSGTAPQFLVLSELKRRKRMRDEYQRQQAQGMQTVAEETITAAGMPQQGIMGLAQGMAPQSAIAQDTGVNDMMQQESVRAPQPEQPMMMADGGVVKMQPGGDVRQAVDNLLDRNRLRGGFGDNVEYDYAAFLQEMGLSDTPDARDTFRRYQERMNAQFALEGPNTDPRLFGPEGQRMFLRDIDEDRYAGPGQPSIADVSTDLDVFMPGGVGQSPMMAAPPALGAAPSAGTVDFDASVTDDPVLDPLRNYLATFQGDTGTPQAVEAGFSGTRPSIDIAPEAVSVPEGDGPYTDALRNYLSGFRGDRGLSRPFEADPLDPRSPSYASVSVPGGDGPYTGALRNYLDSYRGDRGLSRPFETDPLDPRSPSYAMAAAPTEDRTTAAEELAEINQRLSDPNLSDRVRGFLENRKAILEARIQVGEAPSFIMEQIDSAAGQVRTTLDPLIAGALSYFNPNAAESFAAQGEETAAAFRSAAEQEEAERRARLAALGIGDEVVVDEAPRPVEEQALSFGLDGLDIPGSGTPLSFGGVTPSAADIPLSTGREPSGEPTTSLPLGRPATVPGTKPVADRSGGTGGGGAGDFGPIESRIARMLEEREKSAEADKWLSLAQTGLALMASDQPTLGGAIGEAGLAGIGALQQARSQYDKDIMSLLDMQAGIQRARAAGARSARTGGLTASNLTSRINSLEGDQLQLLVAINNAKNNPDPDLLMSDTEVDVSSLEQMFLGNQLELQQLRGQLNRLGGDAGVTSEQDFDATAS